MNLDQILLFELFHESPGLAFVALYGALSPDALDDFFEGQIPRRNPLDQSHDLDTPGNRQRVGELSIAECFECPFELRPAVVRRNGPELLELGAGEGRLGTRDG